MYISIQTLELIDQRLSELPKEKPIYARIRDFENWLKGNENLSLKLLGANLFTDNISVHKFINVNGRLRNFFYLQEQDLLAFKAMQGFKNIDSNKKSSIYEWLFLHEALHKNISVNFNNPIVDGHYLIIEDPEIYINMKDYYNIYSFVLILNFCIFR